jgi:hypothetical protein
MEAIARIATKQKLRDSWHWRPFEKLPSASSTPRASSTITTVTECRNQRMYGMCCIIYLEATNTRQA